MDRLPHTPDTYDAMFTAGGYAGVYSLPYRHTWYYPLYKAVIAAAKRHAARQILEVGCGTGGFAHLLFDTSNIAYHGFDFSSEAVRQARARTARADAFEVADATRAESYQHVFDTIVCTEVLEHIEPDREAISLWPGGTWCICSVPNFDSSAHVRFFTKESEVLERYGDLLDIASVVRIKKPAIPDISMRNRLRHLRWNLTRPSRLLTMLGISSFENSGGWFVFVGKRR